MLGSLDDRMAEAMSDNSENEQTQQHSKRQKEGTVRNENFSKNSGLCQLKDPL